MNPLVSIIIPTYNRAYLIGETLNSIVEQTYTNWECLVIDDGSSDNSEAVLLDYTRKDNRISFYKRPTHLPKGANACRNYGFRLSKGDFINWFDSDDIMAPQKLEVQVEALMANKHAPYCICQTLWFDKKRKKSLGLRAESISSDNRFQDYVLNKIFWSILAPIWRRTFLVENNLIFDETLYQSQEYDFHIKALAFNDNYIAIEDVLVTMYKHTDNLSNNIYSDKNKLVSNLQVKKMVFDNFSCKLSNNGRIKFHETLTLMFKDLLLLKDFKQAKNYKRILISSLKYLKLSIFKKVIFVFKLNIAFLFYIIFGRGYQLIKPIK